MLRAAIAAITTACFCAAPGLAQQGGLAHVETRGEGETHLVLVPGLLCDWSVWESFMERNGSRYTMHAVTLPGFGGTDPLPEPDSIEGTPWIDSAVESIAGYIEAEGLEAPIVVGHSLGGHIALRLSFEHPERIGGVVSVDGMAAMPLAGMRGIGEARRAEVVENQIGPTMLGAPDAQWYAQMEFQGPVQMTDQELYRSWMKTFRQTPADVGKRYMIELMKSDVTDDLANAGTRIFLMPADNEPQQRFLGGEAAVKAIWAVQVERAPEELVTMLFAPDSRHFIMFDRPEWFDEHIEKFVEGEAIGPR